MLAQHAIEREKNKEWRLCYIRAYVTLKHISRLVVCEYKDEILTLQLRISQVD